MMIKMLLEESNQYFYCEARKTSHHDFEGIVHFLHKVGDGNAFVRGNTHHVDARFESHRDALTAAERHGKQIAMQLVPATSKPRDNGCYESGTQNVTRMAASQQEKPAC